MFLRSVAAEAEAMEASLNEMRLQPSMSAELGGSRIKKKANRQKKVYY